MLKVAAVPSKAKASSRGTGSSGRRMASINPRPKFNALKPYWTSTPAVDIDIADVDMSADVIRETAVPSAPPRMATGSRTCRTDGRIADSVGSRPSVSQISRPVAYNANSTPNEIRVQRAAAIRTAPLGAAAHANSRGSEGHVATLLTPIFRAALRCLV